MDILKLTPAYKDYIWGGTKLKSEYNKQSDLEIIAESWELSCHPNGECVVANGEYAGKTLSAYITIKSQAGHSPLGGNCRGMSEFPILIKLIDAKTDLSVQVHPDDAFALSHEGQLGKTEVWIVLDHEQGASIYYGLKRAVSRTEFENSIADGSVLKLLDKVQVKRGDVFFMSPGTVHAIGAGIVIAEIQQNSDVTYRLCDYGRKGADGKPRPLHIEKGSACADLNPVSVPPPPEGNLVSCRYFTVKSLKAEGSLTCHAGDESFQAILVTKGAGSIWQAGGAIEYRKGDCFFVPANTGEYKITGTGEMLVSSV